MTCNKMQVIFYVQIFFYNNFLLSCHKLGRLFYNMSFTLFYFENLNFNKILLLFFNEIFEKYPDYLASSKQ